MYLPPTSDVIALSSTLHIAQGKASDRSSLIGIVTAIIGNILISFALNTQRYAHVRLEQEYNEKRSYSPSRQRKSNGKLSYGATQDGNGKGPRASEQEQSQDDRDSSSDHMQGSFQSDDTIRPGEKNEDDEGKKPYIKSKIWWAGIIMMTVGEAGNFLAYGFAPASIVSPLGVVALISNCLIAPLALKEKFRQRDFWGVLIAILGAVTVVLSANQNEPQIGPDILWKHYIKRWEFLVYVIVTIVAISVLMFLSPKYGKKTIAVDLGLVGLFGGYTAVSTKGVASLLSGSLYKAFTYPIFYVLILVLVASAIMQIRYLNNALQNFNSTQVIPTQFVCFTLSVIIASAILYRELEYETADHAIKFIAGCLLTFFGVYLITSGHKPETEDEKEEYDADQADEQIHLLDEDDQAASERTPLRLDTSHKPPHPHHDRLLTPGQAMVDTPFPVTPPHSPNLPSIAVTPAGDSPSRSPFASTTSLPRPHTPVRHASDTAAQQTPFFTPSTSRRQFPRTDSSPADPETPTRRSRRYDSPPKPDSEAVAAAVAQPGFLRRPTRDSIQRLLPDLGPLLIPLSSSSLSGIVADHVRRGEGSPLSVRQRLRRSRTARRFDERRQSVQPGDEESQNGLLSRQMTHDETAERRRTVALGTQSAEDVDAFGEGSSDRGKARSRLRSMSETLGNLMGGEGKRGKRREDEGGGNSNGQ